MIHCRTLILTIGTTALEGVLTRAGRVLDEGSHPVEQDLIRTAWDTGLSSLQDPLKVLCAKLGCKPGDRVLVMGRPPAGSTLHRVGHPGDASLIGSNELAVAHACSGHDPAALITQSWSWKSETAGSDEQVVLSGSVPESHRVDIVAWVTRAGLEFEGFVPLHMWEIARAMRGAERCDPGTVSCRIGPELTVLVVRTTDHGPVVRAIDFGARVLSTLYSRAAANHGEACTQDEAWILMGKHGVRVVPRDSEHSIARDALPLLSPALQRLNIELKQTLRYQVGSGTPTEKLRCSGVGHAVPGLSESIANNLELELDSGQSSVGPFPERPSETRGFTPEIVREVMRLRHFAPRSVTRTRRLRRTASVAAQSGVIAAAMVMGEHQILRVESDRVHSELVQLEHRLAEHENTASVGLRVTEHQNEVLDQLLALGSAFGQSPYWPGVIRELTSSEEIRIETIRVTSARDAVSAVVSGWVPAANGEITIIQQLEDWRSTGIVLDVEPTTLARQTEGQDDVIRFSLAFELERFPVWFHHPELGTMIGTGGSRGESE